MKAVASFLKSGRYENHLRRLRQTLQKNYQHYIDAIAEYFPEGTKTSRPQGGLALWVGIMILVMPRHNLVISPCIISNK